MLLTVRDAAALLRSTEREVYRWVGEAEIPFQRVRGQVRFNRIDLLEWALSRRLPIAIGQFDTGLEPEDRAPSLAQALRLGGVHHDVSATNRNAALRAVVERAPMPASLDREFVIEVLIARKSSVSTAIGNGIAIPHVRQPVVAPGAPAMVSVAFLRTPVIFGAPDDRPVHTIFLIVSPTVRTHLQMLAHVARALLDPGFRSALDRRAPTEELAALARRFEEAPASVPPPRRSEGAD
jgi:nitrogen PTS system EIIA component